MSGLLLAIRLLLAAVFFVAGIAKLTDIDGTRNALRGFGVPAWAARVGGVGLPVIELVVAASLLVPTSAAGGLFASLVLLTSFMVAIGTSMARGAAPECHCFGQLHSEPVGWSTLARNAALAAAAAIALIVGTSAPQLSAVGWLDQLSATQLIFTGVAAALVAVIAVQGWLLLELLHQHGRVLMRVDALEGGSKDALTIHRSSPEALAPSKGAVRGNGARKAPGLPVGTVAPEFELLALEGPRRSLTDLRAGGMDLLLVFTDPQCGPCAALLPQLARWQDRVGDRLTIVLVSRGSDADNRATAKEHGLNLVLLQQDREVAQAYEAYGTPSAVLVSRAGRIASVLAAGAPAITTLVEELGDADPTVRRPNDGQQRNEHADERVAPGDLQIGSEAPDLTWEDLDGRAVSLRELRGRSLVILFWNPGCGFCQRILPELAAWEAARRPGKPELLVVSTGDRESNRAMGLRSRVVLDPMFASGRRFGAGGTPSAVGVDEHGRVSTPLAVGGPATLGLLPAAERASLATTS